MNTCKYHRILFMGTPQFSVPTLESLLAHCGKSSVIGVFTRPDVEKGRGKKVQFSDVKAAAVNHGLDVFTPKTKAEVERLVQELKPDLIVVIAYGMILTKAITDQYICLNLHASLLPKYRGASPIHAALLNGDEKTGVSLMRMNEACDEGPVIFSESIPIQADDNLGSMHDKLATLSGEMIASFLSATNTYSVEGVSQDNSKASTCTKLDKRDFLLNIQDSSVTNLRKIKAFSPKPGAYIEWNTKRLKILDAFLSEEGKLMPKTVQPEGKKPMSFHDFSLGLNDDQKTAIDKRLGT